MKLKKEILNGIINIIQSIYIVEKLGQKAESANSVPVGLTILFRHTKDVRPTYVCFTSIISHYAHITQYICFLSICIT